MNRPVPRRATVLYAISATCVAIGALLWVRGQTGAPPGSTGPTWQPMATPHQLGGCGHRQCPKNVLASISSWPGWCWLWRHACSPSGATEQRQPYFYNRLRIIWAVAGERVFTALMAQAAADEDLNWAVSVDSTIVCAHPKRG